MLCHAQNVLYDGKIKLHNLICSVYYFLRTLNLYFTNIVDVARNTGLIILPYHHITAI
jgi:hypothetical protein